MAEETQASETNAQPGFFKRFLKRLSWEDYALIIITILVLSVYFVHISSYKQLPSPVYGGDYYRDRGFIKNIVAGNPVWSDGFYLNEIQYYPYLIFAIQAYFVKITGADIDKTFLFFPLLTLLISSFIWYKLGSRLLKNKKWGLLTATAFMALVYNSGPKSANAALFVFVPAFILFWLLYEQENKRRYAALAGVSLGLTSLVWGGVFLAAFAMLAITIFTLYVLESVKNKQFLHNFVGYTKKYYSIFIIAILISLLFFAPLIIKYQFNEVNEVTKWGDTKIELLGPMWVLSSVKSVFFNFSSIWITIISIICLIGLLCLILTVKAKESKFMLLILVANIITIQHHLITKPIFHMSFLPEKLVYFTYLSPIFFAFGAKIIYQQLKNEKIRKMFLFFLFILLTCVFYTRFNEFKNSQWEIHGLSGAEYKKALYSFSDWMEKNIPLNETILSNDESGFMLAVLSGRKVMLTRRTHANYYVDIDKRIAEASVAMYGNNTKLAKETLKKYQVKYFYIDQNFLQYPMRVRPEFKEYLSKNKINFSEAYERYDIAVVPERANLRDLLIISPQKLNPAFLELWERVYTVEVNGQKVGELYKLK